MVRLTKIYTKTGDAGDTALADGGRVPKDHPRVEAYGAVDEANAAIGVARLHLDGQGDLDTVLERIQNDLFDLGADLATPDLGEAPAFEPLRIVAAQVGKIEADIDRLNAELQPLKSFVLPGGSPASAHLHVARTMMRRAERRMWTLARIAGEVVSDDALRFANRASDLLFVAARYANAKGTGDVLWTPGAGR